MISPFSISRPPLDESLSLLFADDDDPIGWLRARDVIMDCCLAAAAVVELVTTTTSRAFRRLTVPVWRSDFGLKRVLRIVFSFVVTFEGLLWFVVFSHFPRSVFTKKSAPFARKGSF